VGITYDDSYRVVKSGIVCYNTSRGTINENPKIIIVTGVVDYKIHIGMGGPDTPSSVVRSNIASYNITTGIIEAYPVISI